MAEPQLYGPIPGNSLTAEVGSVPWQNPPQYNTVEETLEFYVEKISNPNAVGQMIDVIELGYPLVTIANSIQLGGVMTGKHTIDVGILVVPILVEYLKGMAENEGIEYTTGVEIDSANPDQAMIASALRDTYSQEEMQDGDMDMDMGEEMEEVPLEEEPMGLMERRA